MNKTYFSLLWLLMFATLVAMAWWENRLSTQAPDKGGHATLTLPDLIYESSEHFTDIANVELDQLLDRIGDARLVLLGESTHGTAEFYDMRARITRELIEQKGFTLIALEADWPDAASIDDYINGRRDTTRTTKQPFSDFPGWMWANHSVLDFSNWLKAYNEQVHSARGTVRLYGLDFYNLSSSIEIVLDYLWRVDPAMAAFATARYNCLLRWAEEPSSYTRALESATHEGCENEVATVFQEIRNKQVLYKQHGGIQYFHAVQNARLVKNAEAYYRSLYQDDNTARNIRHQNLFESLLAVLDHHGQNSKAVIWAHNSHVGDARATEMHALGESNLGQRVREAFADSSYLLGFGTDHGTVTAATGFGGAAKLFQLRPAHDESYEQLFHQVEADNFLLPLTRPLREITAKVLLPERLQRAIGTSYDPEDEISKHYFYTSLPRQFDEYIWMDETHAVMPLKEAMQAMALPAP